MLAAFTAVTLLGTVHAQTAAPLPVPVAVATGMTINPDAELDTTQVVDSRGDTEPVVHLVPIHYGDDVSPTTWNRLIAMGYRGGPTDGTDDVIYVQAGVAGALNRIEAGVNR